MAEDPNINVLLIEAGGSDDLPRFDHTRSCLFGEILAILLILLKPASPFYWDGYSVESRFPC